MNGITEGDLKNRFTYHPPKTNPERFMEIRNLAYKLAEYIVINSQSSREQSLAVTKIEEAVFWANAGIARE